LGDLDLRRVLTCGKSAEHLRDLLLDGIGTENGGAEDCARLVIGRLDGLTRHTLAGEMGSPATPAGVT